MLPVPRGAVAWLMGNQAVWRGSESRGGPSGRHATATRAVVLAGVACNPDRLILWVDQRDGRRAVDCVRTHQWLAALLPILAPLLRFEVRGVVWHGDLTRLGCCSPWMRSSPGAAGPRPR